MFRESYHADFEKIAPSPESLSKLSEKMRAEAEPKEKKTRFAVVRYATVAVIVAAVALYPYLNLTGQMKKSASYSSGAAGNDVLKESVVAPGDTTSYAVLFSRIEIKNAGQTKAVAGPMIGAGAESATLPPNVTDENLLAAGIKTADFVETDGGVVYALVQNKDGTIAVDVVPAVGAKSVVTARIECNAVLEKYTSFVAAAGAGSSLAVKYTDEDLASSRSPYHAKAMYAENGKLAVIVGYANATVTLLYDVSSPASPALLGDFGQSGGYSTSRTADGVLYTAADYTVSAPDKNNPATYVPQTAADGAARLIPSSDIYNGTETSNQYMVVTSVKMADAPKLQYAKAFFGSYDSVYASADSVLLALAVQQTVSQSTTYGDWQQVPQNLKTSSTGSRVRYQWDTTVTATNQNLKLFTLKDGAMALTATGTVPGSFNAGETMIDENNGYFHIVTEQFKEASNIGSFVNENGDSIEYCSSTGILSPPAMPNEAAGSVLYVLDGNLKQVGSIAQLTKDWITSVQFRSDSCTVKTDHQTVSVDLSNPTEPKILG